MSASKRPPPYGLLRGWLGTGIVERLLAYACENRTRFVASPIGYAENRHVEPKLRRSQLLNDLGEFGGTIEAKARALVPAMIERLGSAHFTFAKCELELVAHNDGAFFTRHQDVLDKPGVPAATRVITGVYYFHGQPKGFGDGALRLYSQPVAGEPDNFVDIEPENDTLVYFPSWLSHEVLTVTCPSERFEDSRFAINCWVHKI